jgi:hypothetical protein
MPAVGPLLWGRMVSCGRLATGARGPLVCGAGRVTNPPQDTILPHYSGLNVDSAPNRLYSL